MISGNRVCSMDFTFTTNSGVVTVSASAISSQLIQQWAKILIFLNGKMLFRHLLHSMNDFHTLAEKEIYYKHRKTIKNVLSCICVITRTDFRLLSHRSRIWLFLVSLYFISFFNFMIVVDIFSYIYGNYQYVHTVRIVNIFGIYNNDVISMTLQAFHEKVNLWNRAICVCLTKWLGGEGYRLYYTMLHCHVKWWMQHNNRIYTS